jgi:NAD(P)-dependent dehydrogenase (short-subunit alcohol dehydrogenase family)
MSSPTRVALVTGVSSAIGAATASRLADNGFRVFGTSRNPRKLSPIPGVETLALDVTDGAAVRSVVAQVLDRTGHIDAVVNNAGIAILGAAEESSLAQAQAVFDTNFFGIVRVTNEVLPHMRGRGTGRIVNISSVLGFLPAPYAALYSASKHAVEGYTESLDHEVREYGVRALLVEPAYTRTDFAANTADADRPDQNYAAHRTAARALITEEISKAEDPEVVAKAAYAAVTDKRPKLRYPAGRVASRLATLKHFAPAAIIDNGIRKANGLNNSRRIAAAVG